MIAKVFSSLFYFISVAIFLFLFNFGYAQNDSSPNKVCLEFFFGEDDFALKKIHHSDLKFKEEFILAFFKLRKIDIKNYNDTPLFKEFFGDELSFQKSIIVYQNYLFAEYFDKDVCREFKEIIPYLIENLHVNTNNELRLNSIWMLGIIRSSSEEIISNLIQQLTDNDYRIRVEVLLALEEIDDRLRISVIENFSSSIIPCLKDPHTLVRFHSANILSNLIDKKEELLEPIITIFIESLKDSNYKIRARAANQLYNIGEKAKRSTPFLMELLKDENKDIRRSALRRLNDIRFNITNLLDALEKSKRNDFSDQICLDSAVFFKPLNNALDEIRKTFNDPIHYLLHAINDPNIETRKKAIDLLKEIGSEREDVRIALTQATLEKKNEILNETPCEHLSKILEKLKDKH